MDADGSGPDGARLDACQAVPPLFLAPSAWKPYHLYGPHMQFISRSVGGRVRLSAGGQSVAQAAVRAAGEGRSAKNACRSTRTGSTPWPPAMVTWNVGADRHELDAIINASDAPQLVIPDGVRLLQNGLGLEDSGMASFSVHTACFSFVVALEAACARVLGRTGI